MWQPQNVPDARLRCGTVHSFTHEWSHSFTWQTDHGGSAGTCGAHGWVTCGPFR